ncbi:tyrosine-type recombinase/integrase [Rhodococcus koreensis]
MSAVPAGALAASTHEDELEAEQAKDIWAMSVFGHRGRLDFTAISQPWLREGTKRWAIHDLIRRRGDGVTTVLRAHVAALAGLSESLRIHRSDHGLIIGALGRHDIEMFLQRLAYLEHCDKISALSRSLSCRKVHHALRQMRLLGLTRAGDPLGGLPDDFALRREDIPRRPDQQAPHRALPPEILAQLCDALPLLRTRTSKVLAVAIELLIDTGRRPSEILNLPWDCLGHDHDDSYVLVYDDLKNNRPGRRLPITHTTAELISAQQHATREQFPDSNPTELILLPASDQNGRRALARHQIGRTHRDWLEALPAPIRRSDGSSYDLTTITPYSYRHTYAQRHADAGVALDVLAELMGHELLSSTQAYYQVGEKRRRAAVDRLANHRFDRHGNHIWRDTQALLDHEHARHALGQVSVPYGTCREPSNVEAGGGACPFRFRCVGCDHFHTDPSHLPELKAYLHDLLRDRERVLAATDLENWARTEALPSEEEIRRVKDLVHRVEEHLEQLTPAEQTDIATAISAVRRTRQVTGLGMPSINRPPDLGKPLERP